MTFAKSSGPHFPGQKIEASPPPLYVSYGITRVRKYHRQILKTRGTEIGPSSRAGLLVLSCPVLRRPPPPGLSPFPAIHLFIFFFFKEKKLKEQNRKLPVGKAGREGG